MQNDNKVVEDHSLQTCEITNGKLSFHKNDGFKKALQDGFFRLKIPREIDLKPGIEFSKSFYKKSDNHDSKYFNFRDKNEIYFDREHFQTEHVLVEKSMRSKFFADDLNAMCNDINSLGIFILKEVFREIGIPEKDWDTVTGGAINNKGNHWFASSHYRPEIDRQGCATHKDTGFITVLYNEQDGLEVKIQNKWKKVSPKKGYFIINFGASLEFLAEEIGYSTRAILHRVAKTVRSIDGDDRFSFACFLNPPADCYLYKYDSRFNLSKEIKVEKFLEEFNKKTWNDKYEEFGIA